MEWRVKFLKDMDLGSAILKHQFLLFIVHLMILIAGLAQGSNNVTTAMFLLGDSSVDCGFNTLFYPLLHRNFSLLPCDANSTSLLPFLLADNIGLPHAQPFYNQNGSIEAILNGLNFGSPQATIMSSGQSYQSLNQQLRQLLDALQLLRLRLGQHDARHFIQSSLFYLSFGEVDFIDLYLLNSTGRKYGGDEFARLLVSQMVIAIRNLQEAGVRKIVCMGALPLGCTPRALSRWKDSPAATFDEKGCVKEMNELVGNYNKVMGAEIVKLNREFGSEAQMVFCDTYKGMMEIIRNPKKYGFEESRSACCGVGEYNASIVGCVAMEIACREVRRYVWWDLYNPTGAVNSLLADSVWRSRPFSTLCHPSNIRDLLLT